MRGRLSFLLIILLILLSGCGKSYEKVTFTEDYVSESKMISYKLPKNHKSNLFEDQGKTCMIYVFRYNSYDEGFDKDDSNLKAMGNITINDIEYKWFKKDGTFKYERVTDYGVYYSIYYDCETGYQDDSQAEAFMNTVSYLE